ncbi:MAG TPA: DUF2062 domain-containing protein [Steroidobacteraceae bacterium]|nr:DUF2062 domain-containing protein [Steroidobacteraceae bacterium]
MPRRLIKRLTPSPGSLQNRWFLRPFAHRLADPQLWGLCRRGVTGAFGAGLAICFIPLPVHLIVSSLLAVIFRLNIPVIIATVMLINPLTIVPVYYVAYRIGAALLGMPPEHFAFQMSWAWTHANLEPVWKAFLVGCLVCGVVAGVLGWMILELVWRWRVSVRYRSRHEDSIEPHQAPR